MIDVDALLVHPTVTAEVRETAAQWGADPGDVLVAARQIAERFEVFDPDDLAQALRSLSLNHRACWSPA